LVESSLFREPLILVKIIQNLLIDSPNVSFSLDLQFSKYSGFDFEIFKKIQEPPNPVQKLGLVPCIHNTLPKIGNCINMKIYNKFKTGTKIYN